MKKLISVFLCISLVFALLPGIVSADAKSIQIESVITNSHDKSVTINGTLSGYTYSPWRKAVTVGITVLYADDSIEAAEADNSRIFHVDEIAVDKNTGAFAYSFEHNSKEPHDNCRIIISCEGYITATAEYSLYNENAQIEILGTHNIAGVNSPLYYVNSLRIEAKNAPYKENGEVFLPLEIAAALIGAEYDENDNKLIIGNKTFTNDYISTAELTSAGETVSVDYENGIVYTGAPLSSGELKSIIPAFGIHVSKDGNDTNDGSVVAPVESINRALQLYHTTKENDYIFVHSGTYNETVNIDKNYSDLKIKAIGKVKLMPSYASIPRELFKRVSDEKTLEILPDKSRGVVLSAPVSGLTDTSTSYKVFVQGKEQPISRFPNGDGFALADGGVMATNNDTVETLYYSDKERLARWSKDPKARVLLYRNSGYVITKARITSTDIHKNAMYLTWEGSKPYQDIGKRFFVYDTITEIDTPGEWYIDRENQLIYYYPSDEFDELQIITGSETPITIKDSKNITIDGFTIEGARKIAINADNTDGLSIINSTIQNIGTTGINATLLKNSIIENCVVKETGEAAIKLNYKDYSNVFTNGSDPNLVPQGNVVRNNRFHHVGLTNPISGAVYFGGVGNVFEYNTVHDTPHMGIWFIGNDNTIQYNDFYNALKHCDDAGIIYGNPCLIGFGNVIQYNRVRGLKSLNPEETELYMIYLDADTSGVTMRGNLFDARDTSKAVAVALVGGGRNNIVEDNIILGSGETYYYMSNRYNYKTGGSLHKGLLSSMTLQKFVNNQLTEAQKEIWFTKYPALLEEYGYYVEYAKGSAGTDPNGTNIGVARDCIVRNNIVVDPTKYPNSKTDEENRNSVFSAPDGSSGLRYEADLSTGNKFVAEYDISTSEAMKSGSKLPVSKDEEMYLIAPQQDDVLKTGPNRFVWKSSGEALHYEVTLYDAETDEVLLHETTSENFYDAALKTGKYILMVEAKYEDSTLDENCMISFECLGDEIDMIAELDLSRNPLYFKMYETGYFKVAAVDYSGNYVDITGNSALTYTSSDTEVVTIDNTGKYSFKSSTGYAVITVSAGTVQKSMMVYCSNSTNSNVVRDLSLDNYEEYVDKDYTINTVYGTIEIVDDPTGDGLAMKEKFEKSSDRPQPFVDSTQYKTYVTGIWIYDSLTNSPRYGVTGTPDKDPTLSPIVYYGVGSSTDANYHLYHTNDRVQEVLVNFEIPRKKGWHQIYMTVEYDETTELSYVEIYFDGQLVAKMINDSFITPKKLDQNQNVPFKARFIAKNVQSNFGFVSTSVDSGKEIEPDDDIVLLFNKELNPEKTTVTDLYFLASDGSRIEAATRYEDKSLIVTPKETFKNGEEYTLKINAGFVNVPTTLVAEKTVNVKKDFNFKIREEIELFKVEKNYTTSDGKTLLEVNITSLLKEGRQSLFFVMAVKKRSSLLEKATVETIYLNPLETITRHISGDEGTLVEAYVLESKKSLLPLEEKITNVKE